jgi:hypothetical protein
LTTDLLAPGPLHTGPDRPARRWPPAEVLVFAVALLARMLPAFAGAGFGGLYRYDPGVYYSAGTALGFGRLPYTDFVFLHPPAILLVLSPFGWLGRATSDHDGFVTASVAFMILGAVNAVLVMRVARRMRLGALSAALGGVFYALWPGALAAEWELRLEAFGNFCVLVGLLAWFAARDSMNRRPMLLSGIAVGVAAVVKIWFVVPLVILLGACALRRPRRGLGAFAAGAAGAIAAIAAPFFFLAPNAMWQMTVVQQLGRTPSHRPFTDRLGDLSGVHRIAPHLGSATSAACYVVAGLVFAAVLVLAWHIAAARLLVVLAVVQLIVLLAVPSWFDFYADFLAPSAALCVAAAAARAPAHAAWGWTAWAERLRRFGWLPATLVAVASLLALAFVQGEETVQFPATQLTAAVANRACVQSDSPTALIELNALSRGLRVGCQNWIDVTGRTYGVDASTDDARRIDDPAWQRDLLGYLESGDAVILLRPHNTGVSRATMRALRHPGVLARAGGYVVYRTGSP